VVRAILRIGGSVFDPAIDADPAAAARTLRGAVEEEVRGEVQSQIDAQKAEAERVLAEQQAEAERKIQAQKDQLRDRATGFMRGLLGGRDTTRVTEVPDTALLGPVPDTLPADTLPVDSILPDSVRPDTLRLDSIRPDTTRPDTTRPDTTQRGTARIPGPRR
jgi:hypothetical protein